MRRVRRDVSPFSFPYISFYFSSSDLFQIKTNIRIVGVVDAFINKPFKFASKSIFDNKVPEILKDAAAGKNVPKIFRPFLKVLKNSCKITKVSHLPLVRSDTSFILHVRVVSLAQAIKALT